MPDLPGTTSPSRSNADAPLRGELLSADRLAEEAHRIASARNLDRREAPSLHAAHPAPAACSCRPRRRQPRAGASGALERGHRHRLASGCSTTTTSSSSRSMLVHEDLPDDYGIELPRLTDGPYRDFPRVYSALLTLLAHTDSRLDEEYLLRFVGGYQEVSPLTIGEVWAVPIMLRIGLVENLRRLSRAAVASVRAGACRRRVGRASAAGGPGRRPRSLPSLLGRIDAETRGMPPAFFARLTRRLGEVEHGGEAINAWIERRLSAEGIVLGGRHRRGAAASRPPTRSRSPTRSPASGFLDALDWREFFERVSVAEEVLRRDPTQTYAVMDFGSRDRYRHALELLAHRSPRSEIEIAERVVALARARRCRATHPTRCADTSVGGSSARDATNSKPAVAYRPLTRELLYRGPLRPKALLYWGSLGLLTLAAVRRARLLRSSRGSAQWQIVTPADHRLRAAVRTRARGRQSACGVPVSRRANCQSSILAERSTTPTARSS